VGDPIFGGNIMPYKRSAVLVGALLAGSCASAVARPAFTTFNANLRSGPGVGSAIVDIVPDQAPIEVRSCSGSWCLVDWEGAEGYLSSTLIAYGPRRAIIARETPEVTTVNAMPPTVAYRERTYSSGAAICDPTFDSRCWGNGGRYAYYNGYDYGPDFALFPYDNFGIGILGGYRGDEYYGRRVVGPRWGTVGGTTTITRPASFRGPVAAVNMPVRSGGGLTAGGRFFAPSHVDATRMRGAGRVGVARAEMRGR
jgi:uncharacterized protein YraI